MNRAGFPLVVDKLITFLTRPLLNERLYALPLSKVTSLRTKLFYCLQDEIWSKLHSGSLDRNDWDLTVSLSVQPEFMQRASADAGVDIELWIGSLAIGNLNVLALRIRTNELSIHYFNYSEEAFPGNNCLWIMVWSAGQQVSSGFPLNTVSVLRHFIL